ncbi:beta-glucoside-specific PTS transporter subunit IIABC [Vibrio nigripulchritudo]|nr:beta-glucoside-specific PTS transporter subunit IIABC [Vibrio nigripulchritudo]
MDSDRAEKIIQALGGKKNILTLVHCTTRLRFNLINQSEVDVDALKQIDEIISVRYGGGQLQLVVGGYVESLYSDIFSLIETNLQKKNRVPRSIVNQLFELISGMFVPLIGVMAAAGILSGILTLTLALEWLSPNTGAFRILRATADSFFFFLPILLGYTASKQFGANPFVTMVIGGALIHPEIAIQTDTFINATLVDKGITQEDFFGMPITYVRYSYTVVPIIFSAWVNAMLEKKLTSLVPADLKNIFVPFLCLTITAPLTFLIIGPLSALIASELALFLTALFDFNPALVGALFGALWQVLVIFGLHWSIAPIIINNIATLGYDLYLPIVLASVFGQVGAGLAVCYKAKNRSIRNLAISSSVTGIFGITEPLVYSINLPRKLPFYIGCISGGIGGMMMTLYGVKAYVFSFQNVFSFSTFISGMGIDDTFYGAFLSVATATISAFILTLLLDPKKKPFRTHDNKAGLNECLDGSVPPNPSCSINEKIVSPLSGNIFPLAHLKDSTFATGLIGKGVAIVPESGLLVSPVHGVVDSVYKTEHAIGITSKSGVQLLIHIGIDTVRLDGRYFDCLVKQGQTVAPGERLIQFDIEGITQAGFEITTPILITNYDDYREIVVISDKKVEALRPLLVCI